MLVNTIDFNKGKFNDIGNGILLTNKEIEVLDRYNIPYKNCTSLKDIIFEIESIINELDIMDEDIEEISMSISERDYYQAKRRESNNRLISKKGLIGKVFGFTPMVVMFVGYLIIPMVFMGLTSMNSTMSSV